MQMQRPFKMAGGGGGESQKEMWRWERRKEKQASLVLKIEGGAMG